MTKIPTESYSTSLAIREMQVKTTMRDRMAPFF